MRDREDFLTADLERVEGLVLEVTVRAEWSMGRGDVAVRDLRTTSGLGCFHDGRRTGFMRAVTPDLVERARGEGFAQVTTPPGPIGVLFTLDGEGDHLALAAYERGTGNTIGVVVDLRRPPVRDGAIVDPPR